MRKPSAQVACLLLSILVLQAQADDLMLVDDGHAACTIAVPDKADWFTRMAASWLADYVEQSTGATLNIVEESATPDGTIIGVGHTRMAAAAGVTTDDLTYRCLPLACCRRRTLSGRPRISDSRRRRA